MCTQTTSDSPSWGLVRHVVPILLSGKACLPGGTHLSTPGHPVPADLFGICVATNHDPKSDDDLIARLHALGIRHVRVDYSGSEDTARLLDRLHREQFSICLHLVQLPEPGTRFKGPDALQRWATFVQQAINRFGAAVEQVEIGATCNRRRWCGMNMTTFLKAWTIAHDIITHAGIPLAGPNVTDFEPLYSIILLGIMRRARTLPAIHTTNLFVERVTEPERFDHRILGRAVGNRIKFNLIKKAAFMAAISRNAGVSRTQCSHVAWNLRRINRTLSNTEEKQADYITRYGCLAAASGALDRIYWGPLVGQREGLIDDGTDVYPKIPHVTYYGRIVGKLADYRERPAFRAYRTLIRLLPGTRYQRPIATSQGLEIHEFSSDSRIHHVVWTTNGNVACAADCYSPETLQAATAVSRDGIKLDTPSSAFTETPVYLSWTSPAPITLQHDPAILPGARVSPRPRLSYARFHQPPWRGMVSVSLCGKADSAGLTPQRLEQAASRNIMRDRRNCIWSMPHPEDPSQTIVVKRHQVRSLYKRLIQRFRSARALRSWNGAHELLRRGIRTALPIAYFEAVNNPGIEDSYFVCEIFPADTSVRRALSAFAEGSTEFLGRSQDVFLRELAEFINDMHTRGVYFRDLSSGNVLLRVDEKNQIEFCLIDTNRARFCEHPLSLCTRLSDLKRISHPLTRSGRNAFLKEILRLMDRQPAAWMKLPFWLYDLKGAVKKALPRPRLQPRQKSGARSKNSE